MKNIWIELDLEILCENLRCMKNALSPGTEIIFVVKSNAYGHGMVPVARRAWESGVKWFAVAHLNEALDLRENLSSANILVLGVLDAENVGIAIEKNITPILVSEKHALALSAEAEARNAVLGCHVKIDTGMGRLGFLWNKAAESLQRVIKAGGLSIQGMCTHFASAAGTPDNFADVQWKRFSEVINACEKTGIDVPFKHVSNSAAFLAHPEWDMNGVRPGILLYGYGGNAKCGMRPGLAEGALAAAGRIADCGGEKQEGRRKIERREIEARPFLQWKTKVIQVKKVPKGFRVGYYSTYITKSQTHIATIDVGYADGYSRLLSNNGHVLIGGRRVPVVGRVTMNLVTVDLGKDTKAKAGDDVVLIGQQGAESIWADELARLCRTIPHEILTSIRTDERCLIR